MFALWFRRMEKRTTWKLVGWYLESRMLLENKQ